jgi:hypothetical protein
MHAGPSGDLKLKRGVDAGGRVPTVSFSCCHLHFDVDFDGVIVMAWRICCIGRTASTSVKLLCGSPLAVLSKNNEMSDLCREREFTSSQRSTELMSMVTGISQNWFAGRFVCVVFFQSLIVVVGGY